MILAIQVSEALLEGLRSAGLEALPVTCEQVGQHSAELILTESAQIVRSLRSRSEFQDTPVAWLAEFSPEVSELAEHPLNSLLTWTSPEEVVWRLRGFMKSSAHLRQLGQRLKSAEQELTSLIYAVSHDLRAPIRAISGFSDILANEHRGGLGEEARHCLDRVCSSTQRLALMLEDLLELSRLFREEENPQTLNLSALIGQIVERQRALEPARQVDVSVPEDLVWRGDRRLTRLLWESLLENAWKFTAAQSSARIWVEFEAGTFCVGDNGAGFEMRYAERLFTPFQRMHGPEFPGRGVGLARAARILAHWGGTIWAEAKPEQGARFFFKLGEPPVSES